MTLPIFAALEPLERTARYTPLGIRFWDPAASKAVTHGLEVTAFPPGRFDLAVRATLTRSGVYAFHRLPGLQALEFSDPDLPAGEHPTGSPPPLARFTVYVRDAQQRFSPCLFMVDAPYRGIFPTQPSGSPAQSMPGFFLFSAPTRPELPTLGVVRAQLVERTGPNQSRPASFAVLEVQVNGGPTWPGIADAAGSAAVFMPQPPFDPPPPQTSPLTPPPSPSRFITWDVTARVRYAAPGLAPANGFGVPALVDILNQPYTQIYTNLAGPGQPVNQASAQLVFGQALLLQTTGLSELWIGS